MISVSLIPRITGRSQFMKKHDEKAQPRIKEETPEVNGDKKGRRIANIVINIILVVAIILAAVCTYISFVSSSGNGVPSIFGYEILSIQTDSMYPVLNPGDLIFDRRVNDPTELQRGDIITYWTVIDGERVLNTHTVVEIYDGGNYLIFQTKGENNDVEDPLTVHESEIVGKYTGHKLSGAGKVFDFLQTSTGFLVVVVIPVALFFIFHLIQFFRVLFEYQSVKNRLMFEQERNASEDGSDEDTSKEDERARLEAELREKLKKELLDAKSEKDGKSDKSEEKAEKSEEELRAEIEAKLRAEIEAEKKAEAEKAAEREALEAELRAKIIKEMEEKANAQVAEVSETVDAVNANSDESGE